MKARIGAALGGAGKPALTGKAAALASQDSSVANLGKVLAAPVRKNDFADVRRILIAQIRPDPNQPRRLGVTMEILKDPSLAPNARVRAQAESIIGLAATIAEIGLKNLVEVYADTGHMYNIIAGERRWWAYRYLGEEAVECKVQDKPKRLRLHQLVENIQREDLNMTEVFLSLIAIRQEYASASESIASFADLQRVTGFSNTTASRWWAVLNGPEDIHVAIEEEKITSLTTADILARIEDADERKLKLAESIEKGAAAFREAVAAQPKSTSGPKASRGGRHASVVSFKTKNLSVAKELVTRITGATPEGVNWEDAGEVNRAIQAAIKRLEEQLAVSRETPARV